MDVSSPNSSHIKKASGHLDHIPTLFTGDERGVSSVISVILMVGITVILAAVIATFALGIGEEVNDTAPQTSFGFEQQNETFEYPGNENKTITVTITHKSGETVQGENLQVTVNGKQAWDIDKTGNIASTNDPAQKPEDMTEVSAGTDMRVVIVQSAGLQDGEDIGIKNDNLLKNPYTPGDQVTLLEEGDTIRVIYDESETDQTAILGSYEVD